MTQPIDIITRAMKDIGAVAAGEVPTADEAQDGLDMLNDMCAQWSNENMMVFYRTELIFPTVQNTVHTAEVIAAYQALQQEQQLT